MRSMARVLAAFGLVAMVASEEITVRKGESSEGLVPKTPKEILNAFYKSDGSAVINLEESTFKMAVDAFAHTIVYFYTPNCRLCANLGPAFEKAAQVMKFRKLDPGHEVGFAQVDINAKRVIAEHFKIGYVPHLRIFDRGNTTGRRYNSYLGSYDEGVRTVFSLVNHAMRTTGLPLNVAENEGDLLNMKKLWLKHDKDAMMIAFFDQEKGSKDEFTAFAQSAYDERNMTYFVSTNKTIMEKFKVTPPAILMLKNFDEMRNDLPLADVNNLEKIEAFKQRNALPRTIDYDPASTGYWKKKIWHGSFTNFMILMVNSTADDYAATRASMSEACNTFGTKYDRGDITCLVVDANFQDLSYGLSGYYNVAAADLPAVLVLEQEDRPSVSVKASYKMSGTFSKDGVVDFYKAYTGGKADRYFRTEKPHAPTDDFGKINVVVGSNFNDKMGTEFKGSNVLLKVSDSHIEGLCWLGGEGCGANFSSAHTAFKGYSETYSAIKTLVFAEADVRLNEFSHWAKDQALLEYDAAHATIEQEGPGLYLYGTDRKKAPKKFEGDISKSEDMTKFLKDNGLSASDEDVMDEL